MTCRANVCVLLLAGVLSSGCATFLPEAKPERECERIETVWDEELGQTKVVEYGCVQFEIEEQRKVLMTILQFVGVIAGIAVLLL